MATKSKVVESSFRLGSGRYIQEDGARHRLGEELARLGCKKPFVIGGKTALSLTEADLRSSLSEKGMEGIFYTYPQFCNYDACVAITASADFSACDAVVGVGGGNIMDTAKLCAAMAGLPVINVPTSSATCACYTPLSVTYNDRGQTMGTRHHTVEVNAILADMEILCCQPLRLLVAGVYDSLAKLLEIRQRLQGMTEDTVDIGLASSFALSEFMYEKLLADLPEVSLDIRAGRNTKKVYDTVYMVMALTGVISGLARGSNQCAIAHKVYEVSRTLFPETVHGALHGEMVAIGLICQMAYNGDRAGVDGFRAGMKSVGMPTTLAELGVDTTDETMAMYYDKIVASSAMVGTDDAEQARLKEVLELVR
ncbi:MAG: iron-containing alcohol dehydrogenase [Clostridia bacterium]|nr:iron-containing alcohol dehydrogenase [Clostridia bacterium]